MWQILRMETGAMNQGKWTISRSYKDKEIDCPLKPLEGTQLCLHLDFRLLTSRIISFALRH